METEIRRFKVLLLASSLLASALLLRSAWEDNFGGAWRRYQAAYRARRIEAASGPAALEAARSMRVRLRQAYLPELGVVDRCIACHVAVEDPIQVDAALPIRTHPGDILGAHPPDRFGCTVCHDGQGRAATRAAAHGEGRHGGEAMPRGEGLYVSCGRCHPENDLFGTESDFFRTVGGRRPIVEAELAASPVGSAAMARGKRLALASGCLGCHEYRGMGVGLAPDLSHVGDRRRRHFDFTHVRGEHTILQWHIEHFMRPAEVSPGTFMPDMGLREDEARDLALFVMGLREKRFPASYNPRPPRGDGGPAGGGRLFGLFCAGCHGRDGAGGVPNENYVKDTVPRLDDLAEKMRIFDEEDAAILIGRIEAGEDPVQIEEEIFRGFRVTRAQYESVRNVIRNGNPAGKKEAGGPEPPLQMPAWKDRLTGPQIDAIIAYLIGLQAWEDWEEDE